VTDVADLMTLHISPVQWLAMLAAAALVTMQLNRPRSKRTHGVAAAWLIVSAIAMFMMTGRSAPVWELVGGLAYVQFPWRFFLLLSISCAVLTAFVISL